MVCKLGCPSLDPMDGGAIFDAQQWPDSCVPFWVQLLCSPQVLPNSGKRLAAEDPLAHAKAQQTGAQCVLPASMTEARLPQPAELLNFHANPPLVPAQVEELIKELPVPSEGSNLCHAGCELSAPYYLYPMGASSRSLGFSLIRPSC